MSTIFPNMSLINEINDYDYWYTVLEEAVPSLFKGGLSFILEHDSLSIICNTQKLKKFIKKKNKKSCPNGSSSCFILWYNINGNNIIPPFLKFLKVFPYIFNQLFIYGAQLPPSSPCTSFIFSEASGFFRFFSSEISLSYLKFLISLHLHFRLLYQIKLKTSPPPWKHFPSDRSLDGHQSPLFIILQPL